jgi:vacuolar-type H+-ATPase catalytic subunit A/Vma1
MSEQSPTSDRVEDAKLELESRRLAQDDAFRAAQLQEEVEKRKAEERRYRNDVRIKLAELRAASGRGIGFSATQATVAAAVLALVSGIGGAFIQSITTRDVEAGKSSAALSMKKRRSKVI